MEPYTLTVKGASQYFGFAERTFYKWIGQGRLAINVHYLHVAGKPLIIREEFIKWMRCESGCLD